MTVITKKKNKKKVCILCASKIKMALELGRHLYYSFFASNLKTIMETTMTPNREHTGFCCKHQKIFAVVIKDFIYLGFWNNKNYLDDKIINEITKI